MTDTDPRALVERLTGFTPGPWRVSYERGLMQIRSAGNDSLMCDDAYYPWVPKNQNDWDIIAAAPDLHAALTAALDENERLRELLAFAVEMTGEPDCWHDHHGYCQAHNLQPKGECWVELASAALND